MSVFIIEHVYKDYIVDKKSNNVLNDINISFPECGLVSIVGKSGSGKSTLLHILMGIEKPTKGKVLFNQKDIAKFNDNKFSNYHLTGISMIFQHYNLFSELNALENVMTPLLMRGVSKEKAEKDAIKALKDVGMDSFIHRKVRSLSGGEKQRVAIARSIITNPKAILCDEPTGALDYKNSVEIMNILKRISENTLVIMVSHNRQLVNRYSDEIYTIKNGRIVDKISSAKKRFSNKYSKPKYKYSDKWINKFFKSHLKSNIKKNIFSIVACFISFSAMLISVGFTLGSKSSQEVAIEKNLSLCYSTVSESEFFDLKNSPLKYEKTLRPSLELIDEKFNDFHSLRIKENISYLISDFSSVYFKNNQINNYQMIPLLDDSLSKFGGNLLIEGESLNGEFSGVIINKEFANLLKEDNLIKKEIIITNNAPVTYNTGDEINPFIKDTFYYSMKFQIIGIVEEFSFLNTPKIYYSYDGAVSFLKSERMENLSVYLGEPISYFNYLKNCGSDSPVCSYSYFLFLDGVEESKEFFNKIKLLSETEDKLQVDSLSYEIRETYATFINSFSSTLIIFVAIAFLGVNFILGMISLSNFIENKKSTAVMTCLGARNTSIYNLYLSENYFVIIFSYLISVVICPLIIKYLNNILSTKYSLDNLISLPFVSFLGIPFGLVIILFITSLAFSTIFTLVPMVIYRNKSIVDELRDE